MIFPFILVAGGIGGLFWWMAKGSKSSGGSGGGSGGGSTEPGRIGRPTGMEVSVIDGATNIKITNARHAMSWARAVADDNQIQPDNVAADALTVIAETLVGEDAAPISGIQFAQWPGPGNDEEWDDILTYAGDITWSDLLTRAEGAIAKAGLT